jgi:hypothetical protein
MYKMLGRSLFWPLFLATIAMCTDRRRGREAGTGSEHLINNGHETEQEQNTEGVSTGETTTMLIKGTHQEADRNREVNQQIDPRAPERESGSRRDNAPIHRARVVT